MMTRNPAPRRPVLPLATKPAPKRKIAKKPGSTIHKTPLGDGRTLVVEWSTGVLSKDGKTPFAPGVMMYGKMAMREEVNLENFYMPGGEAEFMSACDFTHRNLSMLIGGLIAGRYTRIEVIDDNNEQTNYRIE